MVDTSQLIKERNDIFTSDMVACFIENEQITNLIASSPTSVLSRILSEKSILRPDMAKERELVGSSRCVLDRDPKLFKLMQSDVFLFTEKKFLDLSLAIPLFADGLPKRLWLKKSGIYSYNLVSAVLHCDSQFVNSTDLDKEINVI